jgi:hypothetical protein
MKSVKIHECGQGQGVRFATLLTPISALGAAALPPRVYPDVAWGRWRGVHIPGCFAGIRSRMWLWEVPQGECKRDPTSTAASCTRYRQVYIPATGLPLHYQRVQAQGWVRETETTRQPSFSRHMHICGCWYWWNNVSCRRWILIPRIRTHIVRPVLMLMPEFGCMLSDYPIPGLCHTSAYSCYASSC